MRFRPVKVLKGVLDLHRIFFLNMLHVSRRFSIFLTWYGLLNRLRVDAR